MAFPLRIINADFNTRLFLASSCAIYHIRLCISFMNSSYASSFKVDFSAELCAALGIELFTSDSTPKLSIIQLISINIHIQNYLPLFVCFFTSLSSLLTRKATGVNLVASALRFLSCGLASIVALSVM